MADRNQVISGLFEMVVRDTWKDIDPHRSRYQPILNGALELLKEQEPAKVVDGRPRCRFECGNCGTEFAFVYNYCPSCGRKVKWDE